MSYKRTTTIEPKNDNMWSSTGVYPWYTTIFVIYKSYAWLVKSLNSFTIYADDTEIYASSDCAYLVDKVNIDLENIRKWNDTKQTSNQPQYIETYVYCIFL
jgi:hypothetical protein